MMFLTVLISLLVERFVGSLESLRGCHWFTAYAQWLRKVHLAGERWNGPLGVLMVLAGPILLLLFILSLIADLWLVAFLFGILVLLFSYGPRDLEAEAEALIDAWEREDNESVTWYLEDLLKSKELPEGEELSRAVVEALMVEAHERILAVIFWFVALGPLGAVLYRLTSVLESASDDDSGFSQAVRRLHGILGILPAYVCAFTYALAGDFVAAIGYARDNLTRWQSNIRQILIDSGLGAMSFERESAAASDADRPQLLLVSIAVALVRRAVVASLAIIALLTLAGWGG